MNAPSPILPSLSRWGLPTLMLVVATFFVYYFSLHGDWVWDDNTLIRQNHFIHDSTGLDAIWRGPINGTEYLPLTSSVEWLEWQLFGDQTFYYHLLSVLLHLASAFLIWRLLAKLGLRTAWLGGLLFAIHPLAVESVAWISELKNTLSLPPFLLAMCAWIDFDRDAKRKDYALALGWFLVAMLAKPTMLMFPAVILLYAWWRRNHVSAKDLLQSAPFFAISLAFGMLAATLSRSGAEPTTVTASGWARIATAGWEMLHFLGRCVLPLHLLPVYPSGLITSPSLVDVLPWLLIGGLVALLWLRRNSWARHAQLGLGFFLLNLVPTLGFIALNATTMVWSLDHLVYLPLVGIVGLLAAAFEVLVQNRRWPIVILTLVLLVVTFRSLGHTRTYFNSDGLWATVLEGNPNSAIAHNNLAHWYLDQGHYLEAIAHYKAAVQIKPDYPYAHNGLGNALAMQGHASEAAAEYREAIKEQPDYAEAHNGLANVLLATNKADEARAEAETALKLKPNYVEAICTIGLIDAEHGNTTDAIRHFETAQKLAPNNAKIAQELQYLRNQQK